MITKHNHISISIYLTIFKLKVNKIKKYHSKNNKIIKNNNKVKCQNGMEKPIMSFLKQVGVFLLCSSLLQSCFLFKKKDEFQNSTNVHEKGQKSKITGVNYNEEDNKDSFQVEAYQEQPEAPNMVYIEGGRFVFGSSEEDLLFKHDAYEQTESVQSFFMDKTEIANIHWLEYMRYYENPSNVDSIPSGINLQDYMSQVLLPDTTVWASEMAFNDAYVANYLRYPGFRMYPVVGVSWVQASEFCKWRTKIVRENMNKKPGQKGASTGTDSLGTNKIIESNVVDGVNNLIPEYRLPTEVEWEYAAKALIGTQYATDENYPKNRVYPWDGQSVRSPYQQKEYPMGSMLANFKRGKGDYAGIAGRLNDGAFLTNHILAYPPNDFGLYNMAGNVNEWVGKYPEMIMDTTTENPFRRLTDTTRKDTSRNKKPNNIVKFNPLAKKDSSLLGLNVKVYKGGSWKDVAYWCSPGTRRFLDRDAKTADIGFRCAMDALQNEKKKKKSRKK